MTDAELDELDAEARKRFEAKLMDPEFNPEPNVNASAFLDYYRSKYGKEAASHDSSESL